MDFTLPQSPTVTARGVTAGLFIAHAFIMAVIATLLGQSAFLSLSSVALIIAFDICFSVALMKVRNTAFAHSILLAWFVILFFLPRLTEYLLAPANEVRFFSVEPFTQNEISAGLYYIIAGCFALFAGFALGAQLYPACKSLPRCRSEGTRYNTTDVLLYFAICIAALFYISVVLEVSIFGTSDNWQNPMAWIGRVFDADNALLILITCVTLRGRSATIPEKVILFSVCAVWLGYSIVMGSRGGPLRILLLFGLAALAIHGNFNVKSSKLAGIIIGFLIVNIAVFPIGTMIRLSMGEATRPFEQVLSDWNKRPETHISTEHLTLVRQHFGASDIVISTARISAPITNRLSLIDYPMQIINRSADPQVLSKFITVEYSLKNFMNNMVPGELFPEADIMTSRVFTMAYRGYDENHVRNVAFLSEPWTAWGYSWLMGNGFAGGLILLLAMAVIVQVGYNFLRSTVPAEIVPYVSTAWLFVVCLSGLFQLFGLDHWLTISGHFAIAMVVAFIMMELSRYFRLRWESANAGERRLHLER